MSREILDAVREIEREKGIEEDTLVLDEDLDIDWSDVPGEQVKRTDVTPENFGRIAAQTAKQVIQQRIREAERAMMYEEYVDRVGEVVTGIVQQAGDRNNGLVEIRGVAREPGYRSKIAVESHAQGVDPVGACVGPRGSRVRMVVSELRGEKVDIQSDQEFAAAEAEAAFAGAEEGDGDFSGRCVAVLANGKRCPNASLPGSRFCGIPAHQEMAQKEAAGEEVRTIETVRSEETAAAEADAEAPAEETAEAEAEAEAP